MQGKPGTISTAFVQGSVPIPLAELVTQQATALRRTKTSILTEAIEEWAAKRDLLPEPEES